MTELFFDFFGSCASGGCRFGADFAAAATHFVKKFVVIFGFFHFV